MTARSPRTETVTSGRGSTLRASPAATTTTTSAASSGRGRGAGPPPSSNSPPSDEEDRSPRVVSGRGASPRPTPSVAVAGRGRGAAPPPASVGRGRGEDADLSSSSSAASSVGRGRGVPPSTTTAASTSSSKLNFKYDDDDDSDDDDAPVRPAPVAVVSAGRGRGAPPVAAEEEVKPGSVGRGRGSSSRTSTTSLEQPVAGRGRGSVVPVEEKSPAVSAGRGKVVANFDLSSDSESDEAPIASSGRGRGVSPLPLKKSSEEATVVSGRGRGVVAATTSTTKLETSSVVTSGRGRVEESKREEPVVVSGRGRGVVVEDVKKDETVVVSGRGRGVVPKKDEDEEVSMGRGRGVAPKVVEEPIGRGRGSPIEPIAKKDEVVSAGRGRGSGAGNSSEDVTAAGRGGGGGGRGVSPIPIRKDEDPKGKGPLARVQQSSHMTRTAEDALLDSRDDMESEEEEETPMEALQRKKLERALEEKENLIRTMEDILKDLQPNQEELAVAMELASYMDKEKAAEEEEVAPVVQPKAVPHVSKTMSSESTVRETGEPTCLAVRKPWIAIGMSHGVVLVFDKDQKLAGIVGTQEGSEYGRVCSLAISNSSKMLLVGHGNGAMVLWDIADGRKPIKVVTDTHKAAVIHCDFLKDDFTWVSGDSDGKLVHSALTSMLFAYYHSATEVQAPMGPVLALRSLRPGPTKDITDGLGLSAACTEEGGLFFFVVFPKLKILRTIEAPEAVASSCIPYLSWREALGGVSTIGSVNEPILALGWGTELSFFRIVCHGESNVQVVDLGHFSLSSEIISVTWLGHNALTVLTSANEMKVFDPFSLNVLETSAMDNMDVVSHHLLGSAYSAGCYSNSSTNQGDSGFLLGKKELFALRVWSWNDRLKSLIDGKKFFLALSTCLETFQLKGKGYLGISADPEKVKLVASKKIEEILSAMLNDILGNKDSSLHDRRVLASVCIRYLQVIGREQLLFDVIFPIFRKAKGSEGIFLELLEPYMLQDRLKSLNAETMRAFVEHYRRRGWIKRVEQCLLHLDVKSLDFDNVVQLCRQQNMPYALVHLYNKGREDFMTPLEFLFDIMVKNPSKRAPGLRVLLYISRCLQGQGFPSGTIASKLQPQVKLDILLFLFGSKLERLKNLIHFDARETFHCMALIMEEKALREKLPGYVDQLENLMLDPKIKPFKPYREQKSAYPFKAVHLTELFVFLAKCFAAGAIELSDTTFQRMLGHLALDDDPDSWADRQKALLQMVKTSSPDRYDEQQLLMLAQGAEMFEVSELFFMRQKNYRRVVQCAIEGSKHDKKHVFQLIGSLMSNVQLTDNDRDIIKKTTMASLEQLIEVDAEAASLMIIEHFAGDEYAKTVHELDQYPKLQYQLLRGIVNHHVTGEGGARWESILQDFQMGQELTETYVRLLCEFDPKEVYPYLMKTSVEYRYEVCLELVQRFKIEDATMYLLERTGDLRGAMSTVMKALDERISVMRKSYADLGTLHEGLEMGEEKSVLEMLNVAVGLCQRNCDKDKSAPKNSELWFQVLDRMVAPTVSGRVAARTRGTTAAVKSSSQSNDGTSVAVQQLKRTFNFLMRETLRHMMDYVALPAILDKIVRDHAQSQFAEFKDVIYNMLDTFHYESSILGLANHVLERDVFDAACLLRKRLVKPYVPQESRCRVCLQDFLDKPSGLLVYSCGHAFHRTCLSRFDYCTLCVTKKGKGDKDEGRRESQAEGSPSRSRGLTMQQKAESAATDDTQAQLANVIARYRKHLRSTAIEDTPTIRMLQLFESGVTDIFLHTGSRLYLAPDITLERKIGHREIGVLPGEAKYSNELKPEEYKSVFGHKASSSGAAGKKGKRTTKKI